MSPSKQNNSDFYFITVRSSRVPLPFSVFCHTYITTEHKGTVNRYEVMEPANYRSIKPYVGKRIYKNLLPADKGFLLAPKLHYPEKTIGRRWKTVIHGTCSGGENSLAHELYKFIEGTGLERYPFKDTYKMILGPNSNTFTQWVLNQVSAHPLRLPCTAWGKGYWKRHKNLK